MVAQLQVQDVTRGHVTDAQHIMQLIQRVSAATDTLMGMPLEEGRSATEVLQMQRLATSRLGMMAQIFDFTGVRDLKKQLAGNRQEFTAMEQFFKITGEYAQELGRRGLPIQAFTGGQYGLQISRQSIQCDYDFPPLPETMPSDRMALGRLWQGILEMVANSEMLSSILDPWMIFKEGIRHLGVTNIEDFRRQNGGLPGMQAVPDQQVVGQGNSRQRPRMIPEAQAFQKPDVNPHLSKMPSEYKT
jgi:hypothetical protein